MNGTIHIASKLRMLHTQKFQLLFQSVHFHKHRFPCILIASLVSLYDFELCLSLSQKQQVVVFHKAIDLCHMKSCTVHISRLDGGLGTRQMLWSEDLELLKLV